MQGSQKLGMGLRFLGIVIAAALIFVNAAFADKNTINPLLSPFKQIEVGIAAQDVKCKPGYSLVIKSSTGNPACIHPSHLSKLLRQGWITPDTYSSLQSVNHNQINMTVMHTNSNTTTHENTFLVNGNTTKSGVDSTKDSMPSRMFFNATNNRTVTDMPNNNTISWNEVYKLYHEYLTNGSAEITRSELPEPPLVVNYTVSSNHPNDIKILMVGLSPNQLRVGDKPAFTVTYQNISDRTMYYSSGCTATSLGLIILPSDNVMAIFPSLYPLCGDTTIPVLPKQISTDGAGLYTQDPNGRNLVPSIFHGNYKIMKAGTLHVSLDLYLWNSKGWVDTYDIVQFNVNATQ